MVFLDFNPRSREGSDHCVPLVSVCVSAYFNPRSREGSDEVYQFYKALFLHFNPRSREGSDFHAIHKKHLIVNFNPRSREGSDGFLSSFFSIFEQFQSSLPRGERQ